MSIILPKADGFRQICTYQNLKTQYNDGLYEYLGDIGFQETTLNDRLRSFEKAGFSFEGLSEVPAILRNYSGSLYIPNDANCFQDSAGTTPATKDSVVGKLLDSVGTNHATQGTTGFKPFLRKGAKNLLRYSEQFDHTTWIKTAVGAGVLPVVTANTATAPDGSLTADRVQLDAGGATSSEISRLDQGVTFSVAGSAHTISIYMKSNTSGSFTIQIDPAVAGFSADVFTVTPEWQRFTLSGTPASGTYTIRIGLRGNITGQTADILIWGAQLELGSTASTYVATTSAPASNGIGPWWLDFDGSDDVLAAGAFGAGFAASTLVRSNYDAIQTTTTAQDLSAGYNMTVDNSGLIVVPDTVSAADLAVLQRYANSLGGYSA